MPVQSHSTSVSIPPASIADTTITKKRQSKKKTSTEKLDKVSIKSYSIDLGTSQGLLNFIEFVLSSKDSSVDMLRALSADKFNLVADFVHRKVLVMSAFNMFDMIYLLQYACRHEHKNFSSVGISCKTCGHFEVQ